MGLTIRAYRRIAPGTAVVRDEVEPYDPITNEHAGATHVVLFVNPEYPHQADGIPTHQAWTYAQKEDIVDLGYGNYNQWRRFLMQLAGYTHGDQAGPFNELICFADNEGTIGPLTSAKLLQDFAAFDDRAKLYEPWFYRVYEAMHRGFEIAADGGAIKYS